MSFGFSVGDFITVATLIKTIVSALRTTSTAEYHELLLELHGLQRALNEIERLNGPPSQEPAINAVKVAALMCQYPLNDFASKLKKYKGLDHNIKADDGGGMKTWRLKLQWGFTMEEEVQKLRAYLIAHVGSLNMRLTTLNLHVANSTAEILNLSDDMASQKILLLDSRSWVQRFTELISNCIVPQIAMLVDLTSKIWTTNTQIIDLLMRQPRSGLAPDTQHTWFQQPVKFEDALGRVIPVPSEYNWGVSVLPASTISAVLTSSQKINAIILDQFKVGPGHDKVLCGEYELFNTFDTRQILSGSELETLVPGMNVTMAFTIRKFEHQSVKECPRPGCRTREFRVLKTGGRRCSTCSVWFDISRTTFPTPFPMIPARDVFKQIRAERKWFKNVRLFPSEFPSLPLVGDESGHFTKPVSKHHATRMGYFADNTRKDHVNPCPSFASADDTPSFPNIDVSQEVAAQAIIAIADVLTISVSELRELSTTPSGIESLGLDSLWSIEIISLLLRSGVKLPTPYFFDQGVLDRFLESFIMKHGNAFDPE
ncbi:hypothetical protein MMC22_001451 [Lobaria immixta]|nr:hypothetical protein [Lobaria immixta]